MITALTGVLGAAVGAIVVWLVLRRRAASAVREVAGRIAPPADDGGAARGDLHTELRRLERELRVAAGRAEDAERALERIRVGLDGLVLGVVVTNFDGTVLMRNRAAAAMLGVRHADALVERAVAGHVRTALAGARRQEVVEISGPPRRSLVVRSAPVACGEGDGASERDSALVTVEDVSERVRLEAMRSDFVTNISHELRTPVGALALLAETLQGERDPATIDRLAAKLEIEAERVSRTIDDLLELSRIETEGARHGRVNVEQLAREAIDRVRAAAEQRRVTIDRPGGTAEHLSIDGERQQLVSALANLLDNAVKYSDEGSAVRVECRAEPDGIAVEVADDGIGIPPSDLDRVFERFYRVDRARSRVTGGTGLGLAIVRHVADNHGGRVSVSSREGEGSRFTLHLPAWGAADRGPAGVIDVESVI